jgi:hypothetical protein
MEPDCLSESPEVRWMSLHELAWKARHYARMFAGHPAAQRLEAWANELTAEAARIAVPQTSDG